ncbi:factor of DNA methylation 1-like protein [Tanacetum coccineum]
MDISSDEGSESDFSDSEILEKKDKPLQQQRNGTLKVKYPGGILRCPFCKGKKKQNFKYKDLHQYALGINKGPYGEGSSVFGTEIWPVAEYGRTMYTIRQRVRPKFTRMEKRYGRAKDSGELTEKEIKTERNSGIVSGKLREIQILYRVDGGDFVENYGELWFIVINNPFWKLYNPFIYVYLKYSSLRFSLIAEMTNGLRLICETCGPTEAECDGGRVRASLHLLGADGYAYLGEVKEE